MTFDLTEWLRFQAADKNIAAPKIDIAKLSASDKREWLITNGLGSYASGSITGANTRKYHGLFVGALDPPVSRAVLLSRIDEIANGVNLSTNFWGPNNVNPCGFESLLAFTIYPVPTWAYRVGSGYLIKQVAMQPGKQEAVIGYSYLAGKSGKLDPCELELHLLVNNRDFHGETKGSPDWTFQQQMSEDTLRIRAWSDAPELTLVFGGGAYVEDPSWYSHYFWPREYERGLNAYEDNFHAGVLKVTLTPNESVTIRAGLKLDPRAVTIEDVVTQAAAQQKSLLIKAGKPKGGSVQKLVLSADNFLVWRDSTKSNSIIAGYHWFNDWGRDSMISLPGLALATGRAEIARSILKTFQSYLSQGMLPNNFPDRGQDPQYNTSDATFWWAWTLLKYFEKTNDADFVKSALPDLDSVVEWHRKVTRYRLHLDESDGLISGGEPGVQLTWMDAKCGDFVVTPRAGKAVEICALWYNFLKIIDHLRETLSLIGPDYSELAAKAKQGFQKFWNADRGCLYDVINTDGSKDEAVRPNQIFALSLPFELLSPEQARSVLSVVELELLTPFGLRSLSPHDVNYQGKYGQGKAQANQYDRDMTYHQGTVWPWLIGHWVDARIKVHGRTQDNLRYISSKIGPLKHHILDSAGLGSISEIFDGDEPHEPQGCIAQAWSVAELLRVLTEYPELQVPVSETALAARTG